MNLPESQRKFEIFAVAATGLGKLLLVNVFDQKFLYIFGTIIFWLVYVIYRAKTSPGILKYWGYKKEHFWPTFRPLAFFGLLSIIAFVAYAKWKGHFHLNWHILAILLLYPIWGTIQQFLMMSLIGGNLKDAKTIKLSDAAIILLTALSFSLVHLPVVLLTIATFLLALVYAFLFLKYRNLWPLGLFHGWLGALFYFFVLNRDPWIEVFGG